MVVQITPLGVQNLGWRFYIIWTITNAAIVPTIYLFYPETADRTLEDVERFFRENHNVFVFKYPEATSVKRPHAYVIDEETRIHETQIEKGEQEFVERAATEAF